MIADKVLPSFYVVTIEGRATECILPKKFNIQSINIGSKDFSSDLEGAAAADKLVNGIISAIHATDFKKDVQLNPEFFPFAPPLDISKAAKEETLDVEVIANDIHKHMESSVMPVVITKHFDEMGDFVESRTTISADDFKIVSRILVDPSHYAYEKSLAMLQKKNELLIEHRESENKVMMH